MPGNQFHFLKCPQSIPAMNFEHFYRTLARIAHDFYVTFVVISVRVVHGTHVIVLV